MASTWPLAFDATFPGYPYQDEIEYITGEQANSWVSAIQALEQGIGFGGASSASNPLYSSVNNEYYSTMAARLTAIEMTHESAVGIDTAAGDIQPVGTSGVAGNAGLAADAKHVHQGVKTFNTRSGPITLTLADVLAVMTTPGSIIVGGIGDTGQLLTIGPANSVLQVDPTGTFLEFGSAGSSTVASGDTKFTTALLVPTGWLAANGAAVSRTTYASLLTATTLSQSITVTNGTETLNGLSATLTALMAVGMPIEIPGYLPSGTTITGVGGTSITVSNNTTNGGTATYTVFPYGNGNGSTTFNVIDMRGRTAVGAAGPGGNAQPTYAVGASGGEQLHTLQAGEEAVHTHPAYGSDGGHSHPSGQILEGFIEGAAGSSASFFNLMGQQNTGIGYASISVGVEGNAGGSGHNNMQPFAVGQWLVKT
jgi:microcystin-dependent protein